MRFIRVNEGTIINIEMIEEFTIDEDLKFGGYILNLHTKCSNSETIQLYRSNNMLFLKFLQIYYCNLICDSSVSIVYPRTSNFDKILKIAENCGGEINLKTLELRDKILDKKEEQRIEKITSIKEKLAEKIEALERALNIKYDAIFYEYVMILNTSIQ